MALKKTVQSKIRSALGGMLLGVVLVFASIAMFWINEGQAVTNYRSIRELVDYTVEISPLQVNPDHEGSPVYLSWRAQSSDQLHDRQFGIRRAGLRLVRIVEMLQWQETRPTPREIERGIEPTYEAVWARERISSEGFLKPEEHENPPMRYITQTWLAGEVTMGAFRLPPEFVLKLENYVDVDATNAVPTIPEEVLHYAGKLYIGENPQEPQIGDMRIAFQLLDSQQVSLIARQFGDTFGSYMSRDGTVRVPIREGVHSKEELLRYELAQVRSLTILLRLLGFCLAFAGLMMVFSPLTLLAGSVPIIQRIVRFGLGMMCAILAGVLALSTIGIAWLLHRPVLATVLGLVVLALVLVVVRVMRKPKISIRRLERRVMAPA